MLCNVLCSYSAGLKSPALLGSRADTDIIGIALQAAGIRTAGKQALNHFAVRCQHLVELIDIQTVAGREISKGLIEQLIRAFSHRDQILRRLQEFFIYSGLAVSVISLHSGFQHVCINSSSRSDIV